MRVYTELLCIPILPTPELRIMLFDGKLLPRQEYVIRNELRYRNRLIKMKIKQE